MPQYQGPRAVCFQSSGLRLFAASSVGTLVWTCRHRSPAGLVERKNQLWGYFPPAGGVSRPLLAIDVMTLSFRKSPKDWLAR
jgi:hypothetical protein